MTTRFAIAAASDIRPNALDEKVLAGYLHFLDAEFSEVFQVPIPDNLWPEDQELLVPEPMSRVYINWLCCIIDWIQLDMEIYEIDQQQYEAAYEEARAWWRRHLLPKISASGAKLEWFPKIPTPQQAADTVEEEITETETTTGGGTASGGGTQDGDTTAPDYEALSNKPKIEGQELLGDKSFEELGLDTIAPQEIDEIIFGEAGDDT